MLYEFASTDGERIERELPMHKAPKFGAGIVVNGKLYRRIASAPAAIKVSENIHFTSHSLPRATPTKTGELVSPYSKNVEPGTGKPRFSSIRDVCQAEAFSFHNEPDHRIVYD